MSNNYKRGYRAEKKIADLVGGKRLGILGKEDISDSRNKLSYEVKIRKKLPKFLKDCYAQAVRNCPKDRTAVVVLKEKNKQYKDCLVILSFKDFIECCIRKEK